MECALLWRSGLFAPKNMPEIRLENRGETSMEKSRMRPVTSGKSVRMSYSRQKEVLEMPNLIEIQKDSYQWFLDEGLK